eukprot:CAMPEP_0174274560 /NCGR_PEP_ID=MMETSP0439-20130205/58353_1 /TAXON_ID=0 /ORGANISM="Stereomyxa ramosa, Strain Chinc5" /LENGTH=162 /DNA_ID=CAMNT_0015366381 /DNA_START=16 /DNA_END=504 /DNA_ORIENTATION=+
MTFNASIFNKPLGDSLVHGTMFYSLDRASTRVEWGREKGQTDEVYWMVLENSGGQETALNWRFDTASKKCDCWRKDTWIQLCFDASNFRWRAVEDHSSDGWILWEYLPTSTLWNVTKPCDPLSFSGSFEGASSLLAGSFDNFVVTSLPPSTWTLPSSCPTDC